MRGPVTALGEDGEEVEIAPDEDGELIAYVFKTLADPYAGRLNLFRVYSGVLRGDSQVTNVTQRAKERIGQILIPRGKEHEQTDELGAGDIGAVAKLKETRAGDVLADKDTKDLLPATRPARPSDGLRLRGEDQGRRGQGRQRDPSARRRRIRRSTSTVTSRRASRSSPGSRRSTSR